MNSTKVLNLAHSPDSDDAFMFYALARGLVKTGQLEFNHVLSDIETLNKKALDGVYEITALSVHAYAYVAHRYDILRHGASIGEQYGPLLVARQEMALSELRGKRIAVPGKMTTAHLVLRLVEKNFDAILVPFDKVIDTVERREAEVGLLIHEGQLTFSQHGLHKILDLGEWWHQETSLPLPLGVNGIRKDLEPSLQHDIARIIKESISYSLGHRQEGLHYALEFARGLKASLADQFIGMYVNQETLDMSPRTQKAIETLLNRAFEEGLIPKRIHPMYV